MISVIALVALLPVWFPWVLKPIVKRYGLDFTHYERTGYTRFTLEGVTGKWKETRLHAKHVECVLPTAWVWKKFIANTNESFYLTLENAELAIGSKVETEKSRAITGKRGSLDTTLNQTIRIARMLGRVLPSAQLTNCSIQIAASKHISLPRAIWRGGKLNAMVKPQMAHWMVELAGQFHGTASFQLFVRSGEPRAALSGEFAKTSEGWAWDGKANWLTNEATLTAQFATNGWWPVKAQLSCPELSIPANMVGLEGYENLNTALIVDVVSNQFSLQSTGFARPTSDFAASGFPAVDFSMAANGNPDVVNLEKLHVELPWLTAHLTDSVGATWRGELLVKPALLQVQADFSKLPGVSLGGHASAEVRVEPHGWQQPTAEFSCWATNVRAWQADAEAIRIRGKFASPDVSLEEFTADFLDGSKLAASGSFNFATRQITNGSWKFSGSYLKKFLSSIGYYEMTASGEVRGPLTNLSHSGRIVINNFRAPKLKTINADAKWRGQNLRFDSLDIQVTAGQSALSISSAIDLNALKQRKASAMLAKVSLNRKNEELFALQRPALLSFSAGAKNSGSPNWRLAIDSLDLKGASKTLLVAANLSWPARGSVTATVTNFVLKDFSDFVTNQLPELSLDALAVAARWSNGPIHSTVSVTGAMTNHSGQSFALHCAVATGEKVSIDHLSLKSGYVPMLSVTGNIPVKIVPGRPDNWLAWNESERIALAGDCVDTRDQRFSLSLGQRGEMEILKPELHFRVTGSADKTFAAVQANAFLITWQTRASNSPNPRLENLRLNVEVQPDQLKLETFSAKLDGQPIQAAGECPLSAADWNRFWNTRKLPDWTKARGYLKIQEAQVAAIARYVPQVLAPEGRLSVNLELKGNRQLEGSLSLNNGATRSMGKLTPIRDIAARVRFDGQRGVLQEFRGQIGGQPVRADAFVNLANEGLDYQVNVSGTNVPLARGLELLLRGDCDFRLRGRSNQPPVLSGSVNLHDGLYIQHASELVWGGPKRPELRPPYFSITNEPLSDWRLNLTVSGNRFLRARTPIFKGVLSANLKLSGSLSQPLLTGDIRADSGTIAFPFGRLDVNSGFANFTGNDPRGPDLQIAASGRNFNYDLRLEVKGPASVADVTFSSTPPLTSEQVLLMLTAGEVPQTDFAFSGRAKIGRFATFFGKDLFSRIWGNDGSEERLIIRTGESISAEGQLTYSIEYKLTDRWSIVGQYDEYNAFNADLKWKIFAR